MSNVTAPSDDPNWTGCDDDRLPGTAEQWRSAVTAPSEPLASVPSVEEVKATVALLEPLGLEGIVSDLNSLRFALTIASEERAGGVAFAKKLHTALTTAERERDDATRAALVRAREAVDDKFVLDTPYRRRAIAAINALLAELPNTEKDG